MQIPRKLEPLFTSPHTHNVLAGGRGGAKTRTVGQLIIEVARQAPLYVICGREIQKSLKESSFSVLKKEIQRCGYDDDFTIRETDCMITSTAGARIVFIGLQQHTADSIKSYEGYHWAWVEEAQGVSKTSLDMLIPTLRTDGWFEVDIGGKPFKFPLRMFIYTLNPFSWNDDIRLCLPDTREDTQWLEINYWDNPWFPSVLEAERVEAKAVMSAEEYARIWEGVPYENAERAVISREQLVRASKRQASTDGGIVIGADIARMGSDRTVIYKRRGMQVIDCKVLSKIDTQDVAEVIARMADGGRVVIDDTGVGGGVTDRLYRLMPREKITPINFGSRAQDKSKYPNIISEMWFNLANMIDTIGIPDDHELITELSSRYFSYTADERREVESKEKFKKRTSRRSPDKADALILCYYNGRPTMSTPSVSMRGVF